LPSGAKDRPLTQLVCPESVCTQVAGWVFRISHSRIVPAKSPLASRRPSGLQLTANTGSGCESVSSCLPLSGSQSRTAASLLPLASRLPSGEKATLKMLSVCQPDQSKTPLATFQTVTLPSKLPLASVRDRKSVV